MNLFAEGPDTPVEEKPLKPENQKKSLPKIAEGHVAEVKQEIQEAKQNAKPWVIGLARIGYATKGLVYIVLGLLAGRAVLGMGRADISIEDVFKTIFFQPFGNFMLLFVAVGLAGYVLWRFSQSFLDTEGYGLTLHGLGKRFNYALSGAIYASIIALAVRVLRGSLVAARQQRTEEWVALFLQYSTGPLLVGAAGIFMFCVGLWQYYLAYIARFVKFFNDKNMPAETKRWGKVIARMGIISRGFIYNMIGIFLLLAAVEHNPERAAGLSDILVALATSRYGQLYVAGVAVGLTAYGVYSVLVARYYQMRFE